MLSWEEVIPQRWPVANNQDARRSDNAASLVMFQIGTRQRAFALKPRCRDARARRWAAAADPKSVSEPRARCDARRPEPGRADRSAIKADNCRRSVAAALAGSGRGVASDEVKRAPAARGQRRTAARKPFPRP